MPNRYHLMSLFLSVAGTSFTIVGYLAGAPPWLFFVSATIAALAFVPLMVA